MTNKMSSSKLRINTVVQLVNVIHANLDNLSSNILVDKVKTAVYQMEVCAKWAIPTMHTVVLMNILAAVHQFHLLESSCVLNPIVKLMLNVEWDKSAVDHV
jgi:hypothetical protein